MSRPKWPHLDNLDRVLAAAPDFFDPDGTRRQWTITEKIHGFNARFGVDEDGTPWVGGRNEVAAEGDPTEWDDAQLQGFVGFAASRVKGLARGETVFGEWAGKGIQKGIDYGAKAFYAFGLMANGKLQPWAELSGVAYELGLKTVPLIYKGYVAPTIPALQEMRSQPSSLADSEYEGVVVSAWPPKVYTHQFPCGPEGSEDPCEGHVVIVKVKSPAFAETARERKPRDHNIVNLASARAFAEDYVTEERLRHVLDQVDELIASRAYTEQNLQVATDALDPRVTGVVLKAMYEDVVREGSHEFEKLSADDQKVVGKVVNELVKPLLTAVRDQATLERAGQVLTQEDQTGDDPAEGEEAA